MNFNSLQVIILAAGKGNRFGESFTKLLYPILGKPLIYYPIANLKNLGVKNIIALVSDRKVEEEIRKHIDCKFVYQKNLDGTANAVKLAIGKSSLQPPRLQAKTLMVLNGDDATLYTKETLEQFLKTHEKTNAQISMMTLKTNRIMEVARVVRDEKDNFSKILEYNEYLTSGENSKEVNCGVYLINLEFAKTNLPNIQRSKSGEYYLTDLLNIAKEKNLNINLYVLKNHSEWIGINDKKDLKYAENIIKKRKVMKTLVKSKESVHFLGIAGSGASACAKLAEQAGFAVTGCDKKLSGEFLNATFGIKSLEGHSPNHLEKVDILAVTPAIFTLDPKNPELIEAKMKGIKILTWQQFLGEYLTADKFVVAVAGTHGKSTTTAMIGKLLEEAGLDPTVLLGANTHFWDNNFRIGNSKYFVIEADEFNDNFMSLEPDITVLTNIEFDHPEYFKNFQKYIESFQNFLVKTKTLIIANLADRGVHETLNSKSKEKDFSFPDVTDFSKNIIDFPIKISGIHNLYAATAAYNLGLHLKIDRKNLIKSLEIFPGIKRRMEMIGNVNGAKIFSDFAHHPTAIKVATQELKKQYPDKNIWIVYEPHMFSRTKALFKEFIEIFRNLPASGVIIVDIYPSREQDTGKIHAKDLVNAIDKPTVEYARDFDKLWEGMKPTLSDNDILVFMGAGDMDSKIKLKIND